MTDTPSLLPTGADVRPLVRDDARAVFEVMAAQELADLGVVEIEEADIVGDWQRPSFDVSTSTTGVFIDDRLVAYAEVMSADRGDAAVHPDHRGHGIGTWLASWMQDLARSRGGSIIGMPVPEGSPGDALLTGLGYHVRWTSWVLKLDPTSSVPERPLPPGFTVGTARPNEHHAVHDLIEDAFLEWSERERESFDDFAAVTSRRPGFEPWHLRVVRDPDGVAVACAHVTLVDAEDGRGCEAYLSRLATRADQRGRGLAQALMVDTFAVAREHGAGTTGLSTDSRTGALGLYEKVGMKVTSTWVHRAIHLT